VADPASRRRDFAHRPEPILRQCRERIDQQAPATERSNLLAVMQVLTKLRYNDAGLLAILGGTQIMIESPLIQELVADRLQKAVVGSLTTRFGVVSPDIVTALHAVQAEVKLYELNNWAASCPDLEAFRARLASQN